MEFSFGTSYHPVTRAGNLSGGLGGTVRSLRQQPIGINGAPLLGRTLAGTSQIYCTDCHDNDTGRNAGPSTGPAGPHGSNLPHLLERSNQLEMPPATSGGASAGVSYSPANYELCNKCHDLTIVLDDQNAGLHNEHVVSQNTACLTCHDPHASQSPMLMSFDLSIVGPASRGPIQYLQQALGRGTCTLRCHGSDHMNRAYGTQVSTPQSSRAPH